MSALPDHEPPSRLTGDSSVSALITAFADATDPAGEQRDLRSALSHIDAELGTMRVRSVRARNLVALVGDLRTAGLSPRRQMTIIDALHSVFGFALARRLVSVSPAAGFTALGHEDNPRPRAAAPAVPAARTEDLRAPTLTMLALGARVAWWTALIVTVGFATLVLALVVEFA
jgi:hypothetical protein